MKDETNDDVRRIEGQGRLVGESVVIAHFHVSTNGDDNGRWMENEIRNLYPRTNR